ncbi:hypothetical protein KEM48_008853 [Puccinia striiformis f. sp. tritici PST-130]|nr:hypothetical protein KEM48_008853 [Puccinia striiformis f. sp. tritici PST-130]
MESYTEFSNGLPTTTGSPAPITDANGNPIPSSTNGLPTTTTPNTDANGNPIVTNNRHQRQPLINNRPSIILTSAAPSCAELWKSTIAFDGYGYQQTPSNATLGQQPLNQQPAQFQTNANQQIRPRRNLTKASTGQCQTQQQQPAPVLSTTIANASPSQHHQTAAASDHHQLRLHHHTVPPGPPQKLPVARPIESRKACDTPAHCGVSYAAVRKLSAGRTSLAYGNVTFFCPQAKCHGGNEQEIPEKSPMENFTFKNCARLVDRDLLAQDNVPEVHVIQFWAQNTKGLSLLSVGKMHTKDRTYYHCTWPDKDAPNNADLVSFLAFSKSDYVIK